MTARPLVPTLTADAIPLGEFLDLQVELLRDAHRRGDPVAAQLLRGVGLAPTAADEVSGPEVPLETAREAIARDHGYADWAAARERADGRVDAHFEAAADAIQWGELARLRELLDVHPELVRARSPFEHHGTLLNHVAANGIEVERQLQSPPNAVEVMRLLLDRGSAPDAACDTYGGGRNQTTLYLLVSSCHPHAAGVQAALVEELCRGGAKVNGVDDDGLPLWTAITFGYTPAAEALVRCGARVDNLMFAAALGDLEQVRSYFDADGNPKPGSAGRALTLDPAGRELQADRLVDYALIWAGLHGRREVVEFLLGNDPDLGFAEPFFGATARGAAKYNGHDEIVALLEPQVARG